MIGIKTDPDTIVKKAPNEVRKFDIDFADDLASGETLTGVASSSATPSGLTIDNTAVSGTKAQVQVSDGTDKTVYLVLLLVNTSNSQQVNGAAIVAVRNP